MSRATIASLLLQIILKCLGTIILVLSLPNVYVFVSQLIATNVCLNKEKSIALLNTIHVCEKLVKIAPTSVKTDERNTDLRISSDKFLYCFLLNILSKIC